MATFNVFNSFYEALAEKVHNLGSDQLMVALSNVAPHCAKMCRVHHSSVENYRQPLG